MCLWAGLRLYGTSKRVIKTCCYRCYIFNKMKILKFTVVVISCLGHICIFTACVYNWTVLFSSRVEKWPPRQVFTYRAALSYGNYNRGVPYQAFRGSQWLFMASTSWRFLCANRCHHVLIARECFLWFGGNTVLHVCWGWPWEWD